MSFPVPNFHQTIYVVRRYSELQLAQALIELTTANLAVVVLVKELE